MSIELETTSTVDGVRAVELFYRPIKRISTNAVVFYQTQIRLNSQTMGTLLPEVYMPIAKTTDQCITIFKLAFVQLLRTLQELNEKGTAPLFTSIYMPVKYLILDDPVKELTELCKKFEAAPSEICFELSADVLFQTGKIIPATVAALSSAGFRFMITGFGATGCPIVELAHLPTDIVILDEELCLAVGRSEREDACVKALAALVLQLGSEMGAPSISTEQDRVLGSLGCIYSVSGNFMNSRYAFRKKSDR